MRRLRTPYHDENGIVLILVAAAMVVLLGMMAIAIDASYGFVQNRRAQNASDFAAFAAAQELSNSASCEGSSEPPTVGQVETVIQNLVDDNDPGLGSSWTADFLNANGTSLTAISPGDSSDDTPVPFGACGISVTGTPSWPPFFAQIFGVHQLGGYATAKVAPKSTPQTPISIVALNKVGPHAILGGGTGDFVVSGDIVLNTDVTHQPWSGSYTDPATSVNWEWDDAIDAKTNSNLYVYGTIHSVAGTDNGEPLWPLDTCFSPNVLGDGNPGSANQVAYATGDPEPGGYPSQELSCTNHGAQVTIDYDNIDPTQNQIDDPLQGSGAPPNPLGATTDIACPGQALSTITTSPSSGDLEPGEYTQPVEITGSATFEPCPNGYPGIYKFDQGLWINPGSGDTVTGTNVVLATEKPYPTPGNVPGADDANNDFVASGSGNGAPCLPAGTMSSGPSGNGSPVAETSSSPCGGTNPTTYGVVAYGDSTYTPDTTMSGTGDNYSLIMGGSGTVTLTGPTSGDYGGLNGDPGLVLYQDPNTEANYGFDAEAGDSSKITVNGVVYNASLTDYGSDSPLDYWDGPGGGIPFYAGGTLQTGYGTGWTDGPAQSSGSVRINGSAIVDDFNTDGATTITILGQPYSLPGAPNLSLIG